MFWLTRPVGVRVAGSNSRVREGVGDIDKVSISISTLSWGWLGVFKVLGGSCVAYSLSRSVNQGVLGFFLASLISSHFFRHFTEVI